MSQTKTAGRVRGRLPASVVTATPELQPGAKSRALDVEAETEEARDARLQSLLAEYWVLNTAKNAADRAATAAQKKLNAAMVAAGVKKLNAVATFPDGATQPVVATIGNVDVESISVVMLRNVVDDETFMKIVSASKGRVKEVAGLNVVLQTTVVGVKRDAFSVKKA